MSSIAKHVDLGIIRYANCWEDADILLKGLNVKPGSKILSIASAGDNSFSLLTTDPKIIYAVDISKVQLYLTEFKKAAFAILEHHEMLIVLGLSVSTAAIRLQLYSKLRRALHEDTRQYWDNNKQIIINGIVNSGKFERYFYIFRRYLLPLVHNKNTIQELLRNKTAGQQEVFFNNKWNTRKWKLLMNLFFSKYIMGRYGRDPRFLDHVKISVGQYIRSRAEQHLRSDECSANYMLHKIFTGDFGAMLPHYLRRENFDHIKKNINKLVLKNISAEEGIATLPCDAFNLSDIFEYLSAEEFSSLADKCSKSIPLGASVAYWNLMVPNILSETLPRKFEKQINCDGLSAQDKGFFYSRFICETRTE